ncbi:peroxiredoxin [Aliidiomarina haloalkalitolerans]|uniref:Glutathione-dependent peroxiredoxin n=1 Tax=Aliidiomarina haloalkalitolerans TaxID=859059 RepID=A0A432VUN0_9GAMM|nr:peroxiredoxin [Aliidiomarina haloalkalitolerans]RUO20233.1 peroxiredoxin [Aliidiomarina haloalkalitolerans]
MIKAQQAVPAGNLTTKGQIGMDQVNPAEQFKQGLHVLFAVPGAFTPTCSEQHLPGYIEHADKFKEKGVSGIYCLAVNDAFVMAAWGKEQGATGKVTMLSDGDGAWVKELGLSMDTGAFGGVRSQRFAMIIRDGKVEHVFVEAEKQFDVSSAEHVLKHL